MKRLLFVFIVVLLMFGSTQAADEMSINYPLGNAVYAIVLDRHNYKVWRVSTTTWVTWNDANIEDYDTALTDRLINYYSADFPAGITDPNVYNVVIFLKAGANPHLTNDTMIGGGTVFWDGAGEYAESDSIYKWHVAKCGNDNNRGHSLADAVLTIETAVSNATSGDTIIIHPGDYVENVDLDTANKSLTIIGTDRYSCKIVPTTGTGIDLEDGCTLRNLSVEALQVADSVFAVDGSGKSNIFIVDCDLYGAYDGLYMNGASRSIVLNCTIRGKYDGLNFANAQGLLFENCSFGADGSYGTDVDSRAATGSGRAAFKTCTFRGARTDATSDTAVGVRVTAAANLAFDNCVFTGSAGTNSENAYGLENTHADAVVALTGCSFGSASTSADAYDINNSGAGLVVVSGCAYDPAKVNGVVKDMTWEAKMEDQRTNGTFGEKLNSVGSLHR